MKKFLALAAIAAVLLVVYVGESGKDPSSPGTASGSGSTWSADTYKDDDSFTLIYNDGFVRTFSTKEEHARIDESLGCVSLGSSKQCTPNGRCTIPLHMTPDQLLAFWHDNPPRPGASHFGEVPPLVSLRGSDIDNIIDKTPDSVLLRIAKYEIKLCTDLQRSEQKQRDEAAHP